MHSNSNAPDCGPQSLPTLLSALRDGSESAFKAVYDLYSPRLFSFVVSLTKSRDEASDIVQEVFVRLWEYREAIRVDEPLDSFLFTIGRNLFVSAYRKRLAAQRYTDYVEYLESLTDAVTASTAVEYDEYRRSMGKALRDLPLRQRQIVGLSRFRGMKNSEIARELNLSEQTVKNQLSLGLKSLRLSLAKIPLAILLMHIFSSN